MGQARRLRWFGVALAIIAAGRAIAAPMPKGQFSRSDVCGECHRDIYRMWRNSAHARSMDDPVFLEVLRETEVREGRAVSRLCLTCHAPTVAVTGDFALDQRLSWEGVSCDVCHSMAGVSTVDGALRMVLEPGPVKRGPIRDAVSNGHQVAFSELHTTARACAPCHEFRNAEGTPIMTTFSEWRAAPAERAGHTCQSCHMGRTRADVVDPQVKRVAQTEVNLHEVPGGHSIDMLNQALEVKIEPRREADALVVDVVLRNRGAGHAVPTGMPGRQIVLDVKVLTAAGETFEDRRSYGKRYVDAQGRAIDHVSGLFARGVRLVEDGRIVPDAARVESFRHPLAPDVQATVSVQLHYEHAPMGPDGDRTWLMFYSEKRVLPAEEHR